MKSLCMHFNTCRLPNDLCNDDCKFYKVGCPKCGDPCDIVPLRNHFDYAGTHCTHGLDGTHYPDDYGSPVSDCCDAPIEVD